MVAKRSVAKPEVKQLHGGTLRLFSIVAVVMLGVGGYWLATGRPNLLEIRAPLRAALNPPPAQPPQTSEADAGYLPRPADNIAREQPPAANGAAAQQQPDSASPSPAVQLGTDDPDYVSPARRETDLATFILLCRPAATAQGEQPCGNLEPRPFGGASAVSRNAPDWVAMYGDLNDTIPSKRVAKPKFSNTPLPLPTQAKAEPQPGEQTVRTANGAAREKFERGVTLSKTDNLDGAVASFSEAIKLDPKFSDAFVQRGQAMFKNGNPERAIADFSQALEIDPRNAAAYKARGMAILYQGDNDGAIVDLTKAIQYAEIDPASLSPIEVFYARRSRASLYDLKQLYDRELVDLNAMIDGFWKNPGLAAALKATYREQGANTLVASVYRLRSGVHQRRSNVDSAVGDLSFAIQLDPQRALQYYIERGRILETAGKREQAAADYQQALELSPNNADVKSALARLKGRT